VPQQKERVFKTATPVNPDGTDIPGVTEYSGLTRVDFYQKDTETDETRAVGEFAGRVNYQILLKPGDRVLVTAANSEYVVVCKVVASGGE